MAKGNWGAYDLIGGATGSLDSIDGSNLAVSHRGFTNEGGESYLHHIEASSASESSPDTIAPDSNPGSVRWILSSLTAKNVTARGVLYIKERAAADADIAGFGQLWIKDDTPNILRFTDDAGTDLTLGGAGGSDSQMQYNSSGTLAGLSTLTTDGTDLTLNGDLIFTGAQSITAASGNLTLSKAILKDYAELTVANAAAGSTETLDIESGNVFHMTLDANITFTFSNPIASDDMTSFTLILRQDGTGGRTVTWPASVDWAGGTAPTLVTTASSVSILVFFTIDGGTIWHGMMGSADSK